MSDVRLRLSAVLLGLVYLAAPLAAEEAWRADGRRVRGTLALESGQLRFTPDSGGAAVPLTDIARIRFADSAPAPFRVGGGRRLRLHDGQQITGRFLELNRDTLSLRTAWAPRLEVPRAAVAALTALPGWRTVVEEPRSEVLKTPGKSVVHTSPIALEAGRASVNFQEQGPTGGARWTFEALFQDRQRSRRLTVTVAGNGDHYEIDSGGLKGVSRTVARSPGWHRLVIQFTTRSVRVTCDDEVLWYTLDEGPGAPLREVSLHCRKPPTEAGAPRGAVDWTEFCLERAVDEVPAPPADAEQDEVRLTNGDQLFGRILQADRRTVQLDGRFGKRSLPWTDIEACSFQWKAVPPRTTEGAHVRVRLHSGLCPEADVLEGVVTSLDERRLTLRHALLGEIHLERGRIRGLQPLFHGKRIELDTGLHHLGPRGEVAPGIQPARAEGLSWRGEVRLDAAPGEARLIVFVVGLSGERDAPKKALPRGRAQTEVVVNGRRVDYLNRQVEHAGAEPRRLVVPLPRGALHAGGNAIELRQTADPSSGRYAHCGAFGLALELPR